MTLRACDKVCRLFFLSMFVALAGAAQAAIVPAGVVLAEKQELVRNIGSEPESLDPSLAETVGSNAILRDLFEGLTATDHHGKVVPGVALSWQQTTPATWVFTLRQNARWSNGDPVTAENFVYGLQRFFDPATASGYAGSFSAFIANGEEVLNGNKPVTELGVRALDAYTLEYTTNFPTPFFPALVTAAGFYPLHKTTIESHGTSWTRPGNMVSNGAFTLKSWQVNNRIVLEKSASYWDRANVQLTRNTFLAVPDRNTELKLYQSGENDWTDGLPPGSYRKLKAQYGDELRNTPVLGLRYYGINNQDPLMRDKRVRQALSMVIDRELLAEKVTADGQQPAYSVLVEGVSGGDPIAYEWASWPMETRIEYARRLLNEAGVKAGSTLRFVYNTDEYHRQMAIFAASQWKSKLGLNTSMENMEFKVLLKRRHDGDYQIARNGWYADYDDATTFLTLVSCNSPQNDNKNACNDEAEQLITQGNNEVDVEKRAALLSQAAQRYMEDYPFIPLLQYTATRLIKPWVGGVTTDNAQDRWRGKDLYIIKH